LPLLARRSRGTLRTTLNSLLTKTWIGTAYVKDFLLVGVAVTLDATPSTFDEKVMTQGRRMKQKQGEREQSHQNSNFFVITYTLQLDSPRETFHE
jgi:hypothetical protein